MKKTNTIKKEPKDIIVIDSDSDSDRVSDVDFDIHRPVYDVIDACYDLNYDELRKLYKSQNKKPMKRHFNIIIKQCIELDIYKSVSAKHKKKESDTLKCLNVLIDSGYVLSYSDFQQMFFCEYLQSCDIVENYIISNKLNIPVTKSVKDIAKKSNINISNNINNNVTMIDACKNLDHVKIQYLCEEEREIFTEQHFDEIVKQCEDLDYLIRISTNNKKNTVELNNKKDKSLACVSTITKLGYVMTTYNYKQLLKCKYLQDSKIIIDYVKSLYTKHVLTSDELILYCMWYNSMYLHYPMSTRDRFMKQLRTDHDIETMYTKTNIDPHMKLIFGLILKMTDRKSVV